jgi:hypothetical protein
MERLLNVPKGWEKFYRKPGGKTAEQAETGAGSAKSGPKAEKKPSDGGGGGGKKKPDDNMMMRVAASAVIAIAFTVMVSDFSTGR